MVLSMKTHANLPSYFVKTWFMKSTRCAGALVCPNESTKIPNVPWLVLNLVRGILFSTVEYSSPSLLTDENSKLDLTKNTRALLSRFNKSSIYQTGYLFISLFNSL